MAGKRKKMYLTFFLFMAMVLGLSVLVILIGSSGLFGWGRVRKKVVRFKESTRELDNPYRGFYYLYDFWITDEETDYQEIVAQKYEEYPDTNLTMIQICLQDYREGAITEAGLKNIDALFDVLETVDRQLIVRFVYDREGQNLLYEPQDIEIILGHMRQLEPVLREHSGQIFTLQGLFTGNWGEMHGTRYDAMGDMYTLARQLAEVTDESTYLAVRTPAQWRKITKSRGLTELAAEDGALESRLGLFNDGMLGNETDYGTYGTEDSGKAKMYAQWKREDELHFQYKLCDKVPNGGEVIIPNVYNDIDNAINDMSAMHVTYLNREYDGSVFEKWAETVVRRRDIFGGMDGCTYIERHLGYRIFIDNVEFIYGSPENHLLVNVTLKNAGFASMYREPDVNLVLVGEDGEQALSQRIPYNLCELEGGREPADSMKIRADIELDEISVGKYEVYLTITDPSTGKHIQLANEQEEGTYGYRIGEFKYK